MLPKLFNPFSKIFHTFYIWFLFSYICDWKSCDWNAMPICLSDLQVSKETLING